ncbi:hypothetical protein [Brumimicrobium mesophilum]|uniref:hypothetical protein n=1 Tax=Brumimicrobium mesophilum TaxID=392717 RepID=UPI000D13FB75|nr:hypothetical protein [Brumimicrobium mesophilum]
MKKTRLVIFFICSFSFLTFGQTYSWRLVNSHLNNNIEAWDITPLEELIISDQGTLQKLDTNFQVAFTQSRKGFGAISKIDARHSMKTMLFSENQQMIGFLDNTLSFQDGKIDLSALNIGYGTHVCYSDQSSRFWVFDEQNARLIRFEGLKSSVAQSEISNLMTITNNDMPSALIESQNQLFLFYEGSDIFVFDYYGSLLRKYSIKGALKIYPTERFIYLLKKDSIMRLDRKNDMEETISLPITSVEDFRVFGNAVYFKDKNGVHKYSLIEN